MDGKGGCCIVRYAGVGPNDISKVDRIMLRFRPIAPKPASDSCGGGGKYSSTVESGGYDVSYRTGRGKRKFPKTMNNGCTRRCNRRRRSEKSSSAAVTLSLLPETPDGMMMFPDLKVSQAEQKRQGPFWLSFSGGGATVSESPFQTAEMQRIKVVSSCVTVERVTDAWIDGYGLGKTDKERKMTLERDTCPGFISDGVGRVTWTNDAYRRMAREHIPVEGGAPENNSTTSTSMTVRLVMRERPMLTYTAFTCRVRLQYTCQNREGASVIVPCDVWRMDGGGFAWRLDVKAALCL